jgi:hypothetical protein
VSRAKPSPGFIAPKFNNGGVVHPDPKREKKSVRSKVKQQRAVKQAYVFVTASKRGQKYRDYFNPDSAVQLRVMGMEDTVVCTVSSFSWVDQAHSVPLSIFWLDMAMRRCELLALTVSNTIVHAESRVQAHRSHPAESFGI